MIALSRQSDQELEAIRNAVVQREGLLLDVFDVLRRVPRRVLMVLKLNDLTRCAYMHLWSSVNECMTAGAWTTRWRLPTQAYA